MEWGLKARNLRLLVSLVYPIVDFHQRISGMSRREKAAAAREEDVQFNVKRCRAEGERNGGEKERNTFTGAATFPRRTRLVRGRQVRGPVASARSSLNLCPLARDEVTEGSGGELFSRCTLWRAILGFVLHVHPTALILIRIREERCADSGKQCERQGGKTRARE